MSEIEKSSATSKEATVNAPGVFAPGPSAILKFKFSSLL